MICFPCPLGSDQSGQSKSYQIYVKSMEINLTSIYLFHVKLKHKMKL